MSSVQAPQPESVSCVSVSVVIPTFNGAARIGNCLEAVMQQTAGGRAEILVINDGSTDNTSEVVARFPGVRLINQANAGPAAARNRGATEANGSVILFTDDDCVPASGWFDAMIEPFSDPEVVGVKGTYRTRQLATAARFVQIEYEDRYRLMARFPSIDFIDTYSAGFRRDKFLEMGGYDTSFPVAGAEDAEFSYRMSARRWKMKFIPDAIVYHIHPATLKQYLKKKYKFAFWRVQALRKNLSKSVQDSHTPQVMKFQLLLILALGIAVFRDLLAHSGFTASVMLLAMFSASTVPFAFRAFRKDRVLGVISPAWLACRASAQLAGVIGGIIYASRRRYKVANK